MSIFSMAQCEEMVKEFWLAGRIRCPCDGTPVLTHLHEHSMDYLLVMACPRCGRKAQVTRFSDPCRGSFRRWTLEEKEQLVAAYSPGQVSQCPVCLTRVRYESLMKSTLLLVECPRCGNEHPSSLPVMESSPINSTLAATYPLCAAI